MSARPPLRLGILISGRGSNMEAVARACLDKRINATVSAVIADRDSAGGLRVAAELGIEAEVVPWKSFADRAAFEQALGERLDAYLVEIVVLAGFMRVLSPEFTERYAGRVINIHPALLPRFRGLHTHSRALEAGESVHGASVHFVTAELDGGPVVLQSRLGVRADDTETTLAARVLTTEHVILPKVIGWLAEGRLAWREGQAVLDGQVLAVPVVEAF